MYAPGVHTVSQYIIISQETALYTVQILGDDPFVIANLTDSDRNADQPNFWDITLMLEDEWLAIWDNLTDAEQMTIMERVAGLGDPISRNGWITEQIPFFRDMLELLSCRVVSKDHVCMHDLL